MKLKRWTLTAAVVGALLLPSGLVAQRGQSGSRGFPGFGGGPGRISSPGSNQSANVPLAPAPASRPSPGVSTPPPGFPGQPARPSRPPGVGNVVYPGTPGRGVHGNVVYPGTPGRNRQGVIVSPGLPPGGPIPPLGPNPLPPVGTIGVGSAGLRPHSPGRRPVYPSYPELVAVPLGYSVYVDNQQYNDVYVEQPRGYEPQSSAQYDVQVYGQEQQPDPPQSTIYEVRPVYDEQTGEARSVENVPIEPAENRIQEVAPEAEFRSVEEPAAAGAVQHLIALDDGLIYLADDHWLQGDTLHYITMGGAHNMATLDRIDLELTVRLNRERGLKFQLRKSEWDNN